MKAPVNVEAPVSQCNGSGEDAQDANATSEAHTQAECDAEAGDATSLESEWLSFIKASLTLRASDYNGVKKRLEKAIELCPFEDFATAMLDAMKPRT